MFLSFSEIAAWREARRLIAELRQKGAQLVTTIDIDGDDPNPAPEPGPPAIAAPPRPLPHSLAHPPMPDHLAPLPLAAVPTRRCRAPLAPLVPALPHLQLLAVLIARSSRTGAGS